MRVAALISGGKDSCYNMMQCVAHGHEIIALGNLHPESKDELDSYMFQTVGHQAIELYAEAMSVPLYRRQIKGSSVSIGTDYQKNDEDEVEDLYALLSEMKEKENIDAVSVGAILSDYQRVRVENVCYRLGLTPLAYLWRRDQSELLYEMIKCGIDAIIIKVASWGLVPSRFLGRTLENAYSEFLEMKEKFGLNVCGEGGEYETFTLDCPLFNKRLKVIKDERHIECDDVMSPVGYMNLRQVELIDKIGLDISQSQLQRVEDLPMKRDSDLIKELKLDDFDGTALDCDDDKSVNNLLNLPEQLDMKLLSDSNPVCVMDTSSSDSGAFYVSGLYGLKQMHESVEDMTYSVMERLRSVLCAREFLMSDIVVLHLFVQDMNDFKYINLAYKKFFDLNPPARVCVEVNLPDPFLLQVDCFACKCNERKTLHVQGLSHWAPANIGPYSQAVKINDRVFVAGQIALRPANLCVIPGGLIAESRLSLRHVKRVLRAVCPRTNLNSIVSAVCYVTRWSYILKAMSEWKRAIENTQHNIKPLIEVVVVSSLPKCASVEWQVYADPSDESYTGIQNEMKIGDLTGDIKIHYRDEVTGAMHVKISTCIQELNASLPSPEMPILTLVPIQCFYSSSQVLCVCT
ncbi:uncharacterized protein LOC141911627 isoform X2 [Tubulanus polymorphus]|uniref:uncharacterized protein LOC141911627 isoform X2 n=1 Tax=Tubulanus polymorphus TaxID=672921 RepID=UPI003DA5DAB7